MLNLNHNYLYDTNNNNKSYNSECSAVLAVRGTIISDRCFCIIIIYYLYDTFQQYLLKVTLGDTLN